jgi:hypothetical protein
MLAKGSTISKCARSLKDHFLGLRASLDIQGKSTPSVGRIEQQVKISRVEFLELSE